ncbi:two-component regulator propeller domain-containing protein [Maribacter sp.]|uniref:two-component regulator propeller domain-containing protein n=1 Tax=Maribacter sp. TaxID=1897614 RepID=UPI003C773980
MLRTVSRNKKLTFNNCSVTLYFLILIISFLVNCPFVQSQEESAIQKQFSFSTLTVNEGLSQNSVLSIAQDTIGYIWFNTEDGLNKYDGREFTHYNVPSGETKREVKYISGELFVDSAGILWVVANSGKLNRYQQETDSFHEVPRFEQVITMAQDTDQNYYIGTYGEGLFKIDHHTKDTVQILKPKDRHFAVCSFLETDDKTILATTDDGIIEIKDNDYQFIELAPETIFSRFAKSKTGTLFLGSYEKGLYLKSKNDTGFKSFTGFDNYPLPGNLIVKDLLVDKQDRLWITTERLGVFLVDFSVKTVQNFIYDKNDPYALSSNSLFFMLEDNAGVIWIGTQGNGVCYYDAYLKKFNVLTDDQVSQNVNIDGVRAIATSENNTIWVGTEDQGLTKIDLAAQDYNTYSTTNSDLLGNRIVSLFYDEGGLWIGHLNNGLQKIDANGKMTFYKETAPFTVLKIFKDVSGNMWLCTNHGLLQFDQDKGIKKQFTSENSSLASNYYISTVEQDINTIEQGDANTLWVGTEFDGLYRLDILENKFLEVEGISDRIFSLHYDNPMLWIGTNGNGLKSYNIKENRIKTYTKKDGLPNDIIYGILPDTEGNLWLSSNKGITKLKIENDSISAIENYSNYFGLQSYEFNAGAFHKNSSGILYFGGIKGLNWFNPKDLKTNPVPPKTALTKLEVFNKEIPFSNELQLGHTENTLSFTFSSLQFAQPELNQYKYRLVNNDADWISAGNNNVAHYTNLPPNKYEFQVLSSNYDGIWNTEPTTYSFTILKPWYWTNLAKAGYVLALLFMLFGIYRYLSWRWQMKMELAQEHDEKERLQKLDELKNRLYTNISHEIRTPLTLISGPVENQLAKKGLQEQDKKELNLVKRSADRLLNLVNQMLDLSKLESGKLELNVSEDNLNIFLNEVLSSFEFQAKVKGLDFEQQIKVQKLAWFDRDALEKIISNLLSNAIKYTSSKGKITFNAQQQEHHLIVSVINDSHSLAQEDLSRIFDRFYQTDKNNKGAGIGLSLVKELTTRLHGSVIAQLDHANRVQFTVNIPTEASYFATNEISRSKEVKKIDSNVNYALNNSTELERSSQKPLLLLVEDDPDIRQYIKSIFKTNYRIEEAINGEEGLKKSFESNPDLIISDVMMPVMDGIEMCNTLKFDTRTSHIPIILLTAKSGEQHEIEGLRTGADAYINKPFNREKLVITVQKLIDLRLKLQKHFSQYLSITPDITITSTESRFLSQLKKVLDSHISDPDFNSEFFCRQMGMSRTQLHRKLTAIVGMSTTEFIRSQRLKLASDLLLNTDASVSEVAYQVGFSTPSYFNRCFKEYFGKTPSAFKA